MKHAVEFIAIAAGALLLTLVLQGARTLFGALLQDTRDDDGHDYDSCDVEQCRSRMVNR
jgi:hypothetical protein